MSWTRILKDSSIISTTDVIADAVCCVITPRHIAFTKTQIVIFGGQNFQRIPLPSLTALSSWESASVHTTFSKRMAFSIPILCKTYPMSLPMNLFWTCRELPRRYYTNGESFSEQFVAPEYKELLSFRQTTRCKCQALFYMAKSPYHPQHVYYHGE